MAFKVVLDANVLYPFSLRDTLLRLAERELYVLAWSERILDEVSRNLVEDGRADTATVARLQTAMRSAFPEALVEADAIAATEPAMTNDPGDRHVLATAVVAGAEGIVTFNARHFPAAALAPFGKQQIDPDDSSAPSSTSTVPPSPTPSSSRPPTSNDRRLLRRNCSIYSSSVASAPSPGECERCWSCHRGRMPRSSRREAHEPHRLRHRSL